MSFRRYWLWAFLILPAGWAAAQTSSLILQSQERQRTTLAATTQPAPNGAIPTAATNGAPANPALAATSLWAVQLQRPKPIQVNDLVGVIIRHRLTYKSDAKVDQRSRWDLSTELNAWFRLHDKKWTAQDFQQGKPEIGLKHQNDTRTDGKFNRQDSFETRLQAKIMDIKPNGNLVIVAWQKVKIDDEDQYIRMTGECNKDDITANRTVTGDKIFALDVQTFNAGAVKDATKRGWLKEITDEYKPF